MKETLEIANTVYRACSTKVIQAVTKDESIRKDNQDADSEPDQQPPNKSFSITHDIPYIAEQTPRYFSFYVNLLNSRKEQKSLWDKTMAKRLKNLEDDENKKRKLGKFEPIFEIREKIKAAPFPLLPSRQQIESRVDDINREIMIEEVKLRRLKKLRHSRNVSAHPVNDEELKEGVVNKFGCFLSRDPYEQIKAQNRERIEKSKEGKTLNVTEQYKRIGDLPHFFMDKTTHDKEMLGHLIITKQEENEYHRQLANVYREKREVWERYSEDLGEYHKNLGKAIDQWPPEFKLSVSKSSNSNDITAYCAPDVLQYKTEEDKQCYLYYDENNLVEDPVLEHELFKRRVGWTEDEKRIFLEKYAQHPKQFKKIANALPGKCTKDVIEYYFINRVKLNLHEVRRLSKGKGRHRKITAEGRYV
jgi:hypothetical protein